MKTIRSIPKDRLSDLNLGLAETRHLVEGLAMDLNLLLQTIYPQFLMPDSIKGQGIVKKMHFIGEWIYKNFGLNETKKLQHHLSDTIRGVCCYVIGSSDLSIKEALDRISTFADDAHFGVREWAWLALRSKITINLDSAIPLLAELSKSKSENLRRFSVEVSRPRGVWCAHILKLKENPKIAFPILSHLFEDSSRYVQNSVANWLNDASKTNPEWVLDVCKEFQEKSKSKATEYICKRAQRSLKKEALKKAPFF